MRNKIKHKFGFSRNVLTLITGTTIAQAIPIAISPILTRMYTPKDFGIFALYMSIASTLSIIATGRYELAIMLPKKNEDAINIVALSIFITFAISFFSLCIVYFFNNEITSLLESPEISNWLYFIPITVLFTGMYQSFNYWSNRKKKYKLLAINRVTQSGVTAGSNLSMGFAGMGTSGLILSGISGRSVAVYTLFKIIWKEDKNKLKYIKKLKMLALLKRYKDFPKINTVHAFINDGKNLIVNILFVKLYNGFVLGQYYIVNRILLLPSTLIGSSVSQVLYLVISEKYNKKEDFSKDVLILMIKAFIFALIPFFIIFFFGEEVFMFILGKDWRIAGELASSLSPYMLFHFIGSIVSVIPLIVRKQQLAFYWSVCGNGLYIGSFIVGYYIFDSLSHTLFLLSILMSIYFLLNFRWIYKISKNYYDKY